MEHLKRLKTQLSEGVYKDLELFWLNNTNFTETQADKFVNLLERIHEHSTEVKSKNSKLNGN